MSKEVDKLPKVVLRDEESVDSLIRRFKTAVKKSGNLDDLKRHQYFTKKSIARKQKSKLARIKNRKRTKLN